MESLNKDYFGSTVRRCLLTLFLLGLGPLHAWADGNVVPCWSIEQSKKEKWFIAELMPESPTFSLDGNLFDIAEAWVEQAHRTDYILFTIPKRVVLPDYWVCMRIKENHGVRLNNSFREFIKPHEVDNQEPGFGGVVYYKGRDPILYVFRKSMRQEYVFSIVTDLKQKRTRDIVLRSK